LAVNPDGSINSVSHPAPKGSVILLYGSSSGLSLPRLRTERRPSSRSAGDPITAGHGNRRLRRRRGAVCRRCAGFRRCHPRSICAFRHR
jgi:hypothetical protein